MDNNDRLKTIRKWIFVAIIVILILLFASQKQASALVYKGTIDTPYTTQVITEGTITAGTRQISIPYELQTPVSPNADLIGFQIVNFGIRPYGISNTTICSPSQSNNLVTYTCSGQVDFDNYFVESPYFTFYGYITYTDETIGRCYSSNDYNDYLLCPVFKSTPIKKITIRINTVESLANLMYHLNLSMSNALFNYESTEIINSNGTIVNQQQQTNTILSGTDTTGATTNSTSLFSSAQSELNTGLNNTTGQANLVTIVQTFFTQIDNSTCQPINLPIPFTNEMLVLPCIGTELQTRVPLLWTLYTTIITGVLVFRFWNFAIDMIKHLVDPYSTGLSGVSDIAGGGK